MDKFDGRYLLLDAVLKDLELALLQVGHELAGSVANDDIGRDQIDAGPELRHRTLSVLTGGWCARGSLGAGGRLCTCGRLRAGWCLR